MVHNCHCQCVDREGSNDQKQPHYFEKHLVNQTTPLESKPSHTGFTNANLTAKANSTVFTLLNQKMHTTEQEAQQSQTKATSWVGEVQRRGYSPQTISERREHPHLTTASKDVN